MRRGAKSGEMFIQRRSGGSWNVLADGRALSCKFPLLGLMLTFWLWPRQKLAVIIRCCDCFPNWTQTTNETYPFCNFYFPPIVQRKSNYSTFTVMALLVLLQDRVERCVVKVRNPIKSQLLPSGRRPELTEMWATSDRGFSKLPSFLWERVSWLTHWWWYSTSTMLKDKDWDSLDCPASR